MLMRCAIVLDYTICQMSFMFLRRSNIAETVKVHNAIPSFRMRWCVPGPLALSRFTISLSFWHTPSIGNVVCIKMSLKYGMRCASCCNCTSITPFGIFNVSSTFFFYVRYLALVGNEINTAVFHGVIMTLQFFQLMLRCFVIVYCLDNSRHTTEAPYTQQCKFVDPVQR